MTQNNKESGRTIVSGGYPNTLDSFWFALADDITVKPFDVITFDHSHNIKTSGMIQDLQTISTLRHHSFEHPSTRGKPSCWDYHLLLTILDKDTKKNIVRRNKGKLVMIHSAFRHPI